YTVMASMGHIIDLPKSNMGVDLENDSEPRYITIRGEGPLLAELKKEAKKSDIVYLATDPDREGEAISWHLAGALGIDPKSPCRVTFNEITKTAVKAAIKEPRPIDMDLVDAQQARRVLDRIVGYTISPILWEKVKRGLSAGRVQSVATRLICDREEEIENFTPQEYWSIEATINDPKSKKDFTAKYYGEKNKEVKLENAAETKKITDSIKNADFTVEKVKRGQQKRNPQPPFTTSTLQQEASRKYNFQAAKTMQIAQMLYEGINLGGKLGTIGLITYMRTDSLRIADDAQKEAVSYLTENYGKEYVNPKQYKTKKSAQDAHEAIRPTSINIKPIEIKDKLTNDQYRLYKLIWERFAASQMASAVYDTMLLTLDANGHTFKASGSNVKFKGYMSVYVEATDNDDKKEKMLPPLEEGQSVKLKSFEEKQHFTQPPARYSDATLIRELEENGIGRPSTYAPTISTIVSRGYVARSKRQLVPTELGFVTDEIMKNNFSKIVDVEFTAGMEEELDEVEDGDIQWKNVIREFYPPFKDNLDKAQSSIEKIKIKDEESDIVCDKCGRKMVYKLSKFGKFLACPGYPECKNTMAIREGTGAECPKCGGEILVRRSRKGKTYYACEKLPKCDFMAWDMPLKEKCPQCGGLLLKKNGRSGKIYCLNEDCKYERKPSKKDES
ncbi:MAG: type I DNA topoisomerase, partial [Clostridia bacterium]|nr:type I DNA topoisomerase [Clostridia bacterium]